MGYRTAIFDARSGTVAAFKRSDGSSKCIHDRKPRVYLLCKLFKHLMTRLHQATKKHETLPFRVEQSEATGNEIAMAVPFEMATIDTPLTSMNALFINGTIIVSFLWAVTSTMGK